MSKRLIVKLIFLVFFCGSPTFITAQEPVESIKFTPTPYEQLSPYIQLLNTKSSAIKEVETDFKFNDAIDGIPGRGTSKIEDSLYIALVFGENKRAVMDGLYFYKRCMLKNPSDHYDDGYLTLLDTAEKAFKVSNDEINEISIRANYDHLLETHEHAIKLKKDGREDLVAVVARAYVLTTKENKNEILNKAKGIAAQIPMPLDIGVSFSGLVSLLVDPELQKAVGTVLKKGMRGDQSFKDVKLASPQN